MATFVLVHGSWQDGSVWDPVILRLEQRGNQAFAPTMAGHGPDSSRAVSHRDCTASIVDFILDKDLRDVVLAGHSFAGTVISKVAEAIPERLRRLVYQNAFVLEDGNCLMDEVPAAYRELFDRLEAPDGTLALPFNLWREAFINDADESLARWSYERLHPEPYQPFKDRLDLKKFYSLDISKSYLNATEDIALPPGEWGWHPRMSNRLGLYRLVQMPGSHQVVFTNPQGLAEKLIEAGRD